jgi:hypothetical protein
MDSTSINVDTQLRELCQNSAYLRSHGVVLNYKPNVLFLKRECGVICPVISSQQVTDDFVQKNRH